MNGKMIARSRVRTLQWHYRAGFENLVDGWEWVESSLQEDGSWLQKTAPSKPGSGPMPHQFRRRLQRWRGFLRRHPAREFQLRCRKRWIRIWGPPNRLVSPSLEWTLYLSFSGQDLGHQVTAFTFQKPQPPDDFLMEHWCNLMQMPLAAASLPEGDAIQFRGDLLLHFLAPALNHVRGLAEPMGDWRLMGPRVREADLNALPVQGEWEGDRGELSYPPVLPPQTMFMPHRFVDSPARPWRALYFQTDQRTLYCERGSPWNRQFAKVVLERPLYGYFQRLCFQPRWYSLVLKGIQYHMPSAWFTPR